MRAGRRRNERCTPCPAEKARSIVDDVTRSRGGGPGPLASRCLCGWLNPGDGPHVQRRRCLWCDSRRGAVGERAQRAPTVDGDFERWTPCPAEMMGGHGREGAHRKTRNSTLRKRLTTRAGIASAPPGYDDAHAADLFTMSNIDRRIASSSMEQYGN